MTKKTHKGVRLALSGSMAFSQLRPETRDALNAMCHSKSYRAGQTVIHAQEKCDFIGCVQSGMFRIQRTLADGREHIVGLLVEGDTCGRVFDGAAEFTIEAATEAEFCAFPRTDFAYSHCDRYAKRSAAVQHGDTDLQLGDLAFEVSCHQGLAKEFDAIHPIAGKRIPRILF